MPHQRSAGMCRTDPGNAAPVGADRDDPVAGHLPI